MLGNHVHASETPFKWRLAGGTMLARFWSYLDPPSPHQQQKNVVKVGTIWICACACTASSGHRRVSFVTNLHLHPCFTVCDQ